MKRTKDDRGRPGSVKRRRFLAAIPAAVAGSFAVPAAARQQAQARVDPADAGLR